MNIKAKTGLPERVRSNVGLGRNASALVKDLAGNCCRLTFGLYSQSLKFFKERLAGFGCLPRPSSGRLLWHSV